MWFPEDLEDSPFDKKITLNIPDTITKGKQSNKFYSALIHFGQI